MTPKNLKKIKQKLLGMRKSPANCKSRQFISIAEQLGRMKHSRGKEPNYVRTEPWLSPPLSIPNHPGDYKRGTALSIIDALLSDIDEWELYLLEADN